MSCLNPILVYHPYSKLSTLTDEGVKRFSDNGLNYYEFRKSYIGRKIFVPCRKCINCRKSRAREWSVRLLSEFQYGQHKNAVFLTLTLDPEHYECVRDNPQVSIRRFFDLVRKKFGSGCRYFVIDELGEESGRYHFHAICFNFPRANLISGLDLSKNGYSKLSPKNKRRVSIFTEFVNRLWKNGMTRPGNVCAKSIFYIVKYIVKVHPLNHDFVPRVFCSPGIGRDILAYYQHLHRQYLLGSSDCYLHLLGRKYYPFKYFIRKITTWYERLLVGYKRTLLASPLQIRYGPYTFDSWLAYRDSCRSFYNESLRLNLSLPLTCSASRYCLQNLKDYQIYGITS